MSEELKSCNQPDCYLSWLADVEVYHDFRGRDGDTAYRAECACGCSGRFAETREEAIAAWNALPRTTKTTPSHLGDWRIDTHSTGNPILTYQHCSVIQDEQAFEVMALLQRRAASSDDTPADPYSGELGNINLRNLAAQMHQALGLLKRHGCYHPAMEAMREEGFKHGLNLPDAPDHIADTSKKVQAAPSDRERRYMEALAAYANDEDRYNRGEGEPYGSLPVEVGAIARQARAVLADTNNSEGKP